MGEPAASVIVRVRDEATTLRAALLSLRAQTVVVEVIVVDSGSVDESLDIARELADRVVEMAPEDFSYGRALNAGAAAARAPVHGALSAHCRAPDRGWLERSLAHYADERVAGTGAWSGPGLLVQDRAHALAHPNVGFSNHAATWRASDWLREPFDERLEACEDKEWGLRVLARGRRVVLDPALAVDSSHAWRAGPGAYYRRQLREWRARTRFMTLPPYGLREALGEWWSEEAPPTAAARARRRLSPARTAGYAGKWVALRGR